MGRRTTNERERDYKKDQAGYFHRLKQIFSDPEFRNAWQGVERLWEAVTGGAERLGKIEQEIRNSPQNQFEVRTPQGVRRVLRNIPPDDPVWGPKLIEFGKQTEKRRAALDAYEEAMGDLRRRFKVPLLMGPKERATPTSLNAWTFERFLSTPGILEDQEAVQIIFPAPPKYEDGLDVSPSLHRGNLLLLAVNMNHPLQALRAAFDGVLQFVMSELPDRKARRVHQEPETVRSKVMALAAQGLKRMEIAAKLWPSEMASRDPRTRKNTLQRVTDAQRPRRR